MQHCPLTFQQQFLFERRQTYGILSRMDTFALNLAGRVRVDALEKSVAQLVRRHKVLRTIIVKTDGALKQKIDETGDFNLKVIDLSEISDSYIDMKAREVLDETSTQICDLERGALFEVRLIKLSEFRSLLVWSIHHMVSDGLSLNVMFREFWPLYSELSRGLPLPLISDPPQYCDYANWQHDTHNEWVEKHGAYWHRRLRDAAPVQWPVDGCAAKMNRRVVRAARVSLPEIVTPRIRELARSERTPTAMVMLAIYTAVVSRWCSQEDFIVPLNIAGKTQARA